MALIDHLYAVIPLLGLLIFVHEFGHFAMAKLFGVRVLKFSLGFGSPVGFGRMRMRWVRGGTEYVIAWFPLGGFVRMLGGYLPGDEEAEVESEFLDARPDEFLQSKPVWQKLLISFAGPAMNLLLPVVCFLVIFWFGTPRAAAVIGTVELSSPAAAAGLLPGDRIVSVDGERVRWWSEVDAAIRERTAGSVSLDVMRGDRELHVTLPVERRTALSRYAEVEEIGSVGIGHRRLPALVAVSSAESEAARAGLASGDRIVAVGDAAVETWHDFATAFGAVGTGRVTLKVERREVEEPLAIEVAAVGSPDALGVELATILVGEVDEDLPAAKAGIEPGDLIVAVDGEPLGSFTSFRQRVFSSGGVPMELTYARGVERHTVVVAPEEATIPGPLDIEGMDITVYRTGIIQGVMSLTGETRLDRVRNPMVSVPRAFEETGRMIAGFLESLGKLLTGQLGMDQLSGPIGIAEVARKTLDQGWQLYVQMMMYISINLGILNLLPIPVLDGGQIVLFSIEGIKRAPVSIRTREIMQSIGLTILVMLMGLAFWNDLSRHWSRFVEWLGGGSF